jgi:AmmeMemoRadiSam system protein A
MMPEQVLEERERVALLRIARDAIVQTVGADDELREPVDESDRPSLCAGAFVSLHKKGQLRGCIGTFDTSQPVIKQVEEMAVAAATRDPRFRPVSQREVRDIDIEISVLTPPRTVTSTDEIQVGVHGLLVTRGYQRGVLLPQVATEYGWDRETFLVHTCRKAGLPDEAWQDPATVIQVFTAEVFGER